MQKYNILKIISEKIPKVKDVFFIAIDGHGGSGKSTLSAYLAKKLNAEIIHTDDFASWDNSLDWWSQVIEQVFKPVHNGAKMLSYSRSKWWENHNPEPVVHQPVMKIMILEGVSSMRKEFTEYINLGIFVDTPKDVCLQRGIARDVDIGKPEQEVRNMWNEWFEEEDEYMKRDNPKSEADIVVDGTKSFDEQFE